MSWYRRLPPSNLAAKRQRYQDGLAAENHAADYLRQDGWQILRQRHKTPYGEIDLLALNNDTLLVAEVKARRSVPEGLEAVTPRQQRRLANAALWVCGQQPEFNSCVIRFDVLVVLPDGRIHRTENAWQCDG